MQNVRPDGLLRYNNVIRYDLLVGQINSDTMCYLLDLYEALMSSIGRAGTVKHCRANIDALKQLVVDHYENTPCIRDLSVDIADERENFFQPIFYANFNEEGL